MFPALLLTLLTLLTLLPLLSALPTTPSHTKRCSNALQNPSFESGDSPWQTMALGAWATRGIYTSPEGGHDGRNFFFARTNATVAQATVNLSQYGFSLQPGAPVECAAWVASERPGNAGSMRVEVFLDGRTCGAPVWMGSNGWMKVGGSVEVGDGPHTFSVVAMSNDAGPDGAAVWIDDAWVGDGC